uniref:Serpin domain-containing protein n=1 Tax=Musca domestica TaxID=7370 RepID=A0A1I8MRS5_MUSDO
MERIGYLGILFSIFLACLQGTTTTPFDSQNFHSSLSNFSRNIFTEIFQTNSEDNIIFSPFSIQTCLAMVRMGADGATAAEMDYGLTFTSQSEENIGANYQELLTKFKDGKILKIANKIYVANKYSLKNTYHEILGEKFFSSVENVDFTESEKTAELVNSWIESKTDNAIHHIISPDTVTNDTRLMLVSAIYFKGNWQKPFDTKYTREADFYMANNKTMKVEMMFGAGMMSCDIIRELDAKVIRLPYKDSDLYMMVILPNSRNGLKDLMEKLKTFSLSSLTAERLGYFGTFLYLPKFKVEFEILLNEPLKMLGMQHMFTDANLSKMLTASEPLQVTSVIHKAFIDVNEVGTAASGAAGIPVMTKTKPFDFRADHPFYYVIMNGDSIPLFQGTFVGI